MDSTTNNMTQTKPKNFIALNAIKAIKMKPPRDDTPEWQKNYKKRPGFGQIPQYLNEIKTELDYEKKQIEAVMMARQQDSNHHRRGQPQMRIMSEEERIDLLEKLKAKWEAVNAEYQKTAHVVTLDTRGKIRRKEECEQQLTQLEKSIDKLSKKVVYVCDDLGY